MIAGISALLVVLAAGLWLLNGGRWLVVDTPSMGTRAPVGSLIQVSPAGVDDVRLGDLVTVRPPGSASTWTHEVVEVNPDGSLRTAGRLTGPDPWQVDDGMLVGRVTMVVPGVGWLAKASPLLLGFGLMVWMGLRHVPLRLRLPLGLLGSAAGMSVALFVYHPLQGADELTFHTESDGARGEWVNTGLLPLRVTTLPGGESQVVRTGEVARLTFSETDGAGRFVVRMEPQVPWAVRAGIVVVWFVPAVIDTARRRPSLDG